MYVCMYVCICSEGPYRAAISKRKRQRTNLIRVCMYVCILTMMMTRPMEASTSSSYLPDLLVYYMYVRMMMMMNDNKWRRRTYLGYHHHPCRVYTYHAYPRGYPTSAQCVAFSLYLPTYLRAHIIIIIAPNTWYLWDLL